MEAANNLKAREVKLTYKGLQVYPQTTSHAIADIETGKRLSDLIPEMRVKMVKDSPTQYHLEDALGNVVGDNITVFSKEENDEDNEKILALLMEMKESLDSISQRLTSQESAQQSDEWDEL